MMPQSLELNKQINVCAFFPAASQKKLRQTCASSSFPSAHEAPTQLENPLALSQTLPHPFREKAFRPSLEKLNFPC